MAGRSFFRRLLGDRSDGAELDEVSTPPSPAGPIPIPHPFADAEADAEPTAFDEADAVFGTRTEVRDAAEVAPTDHAPGLGAEPHPDEHAPTLAADDRVVDTSGIMSPNNVVDGGDPEPVPSIEAGSAPGDGSLGMEGIISPNNLVDDPDDDLLLAELSGGSIDDQLAAIAGTSFDAVASDLPDDFDGLDYIDVD